MGKIIDVIKTFFQNILKKDYDIDKLTGEEQREVIFSIIQKIRNNNELF